MKLINNKFLSSCVEWLDHYPDEAESLPIELENYLKKGIIEIDGCFFLSDVDVDAASKRIAGCISDDDRSFLELDMNELNVLSYGFSHHGRYTKKDVRRALAMGIVTSYRLASILKKHGVFRIMHSFHYDKHESIISTWISFSKIRNNDPYWYRLTESTDPYSLGAMFIYTINDSGSSRQ